MNAVGGSASFKGGVLAGFMSYLAGVNWVVKSRRGLMLPAGVICGSDVP